MSAVTTIPAGAVLLAGVPLTILAAVPGAQAAGSAITAHAIKGPSTNMRWGPVQVTIIVQGKRITDVKVTAPTERTRSAIINNRAIPLLRNEVLRAQSARVQLISGATMTSSAFVTSLQAALKQAHL
jgi:uncharacterized protein with FMN-binding domain